MIIRLTAAAALLIAAFDPCAYGDALGRLNQYRALVKVPAVREDANLDPGEEAHARYLVENYADALRAQRPLGVDMHVEDRANHWYSYAGFVAGRASDVLIATGQQSADWAIDEWIAAPFHRFSLLDHDLAAIGYGAYCAGDVCAAAINVTSGATSGSRRFIRRMTSGEPITGDSDALGGGWGTRYPQPIKFPPDGAVVELLSLSNEWPDPTSSCPGFKYPVGLPITIQFGWNLKPRITGGSLKEDGRPIAACAFDAENYRNPDEVTQKLGRAGLTSAAAVVIVLREPLKPGAKYEVQAVIDDAAYDWSFSTAGAQRP